MLLNLVRGGRLLACHSRSAIRHCQTMSPLQLGKSSTHEGASSSQGALSEMKNKAATVDPLVFDRHRVEGATALMKERQEHATMDEINEAFKQGLNSRNMAEVSNDRRTMSPLQQGKSAHEADSCSPGAMKKNAATVDPLVLGCHREEGATALTKKRLEHSARSDEIDEAFRQGLKSRHMAGVLDAHRTMSLRQRRHMLQLPQSESAHEVASRSPGDATVDPSDCYRDRRDRAIAYLKKRVEVPGTSDDMKKSFRQSLKALNVAREYEEKTGSRMIVLC